MRAALLLSVLVGGCAARDLPARAGTSCPDCQTTICQNRETLAIEYLGSSGYVLRRGEDVVLLAPFISNAGILAASSLTRLRPNVEALERWLPDVSMASAIIVGHGHYDHLLDVPWIAEHRAPHAMVYGNRTVAHLLAAVPALRGRVTALDDAYLEDGEEPWISIPGTRVRFLPIASGHAPHFAGMKLMNGRLDTDLDKLPARACGWLDGRALAFLIEFLHPTDDHALFSLHYQDAASNPTLGFPPGRFNRVDAALACVAAHLRVSGYPDRLLAQIRPRHVVLGHWENFFAPYTQDPKSLRGVPLSHPRDFIRRVEDYVAATAGSSWILPAPGSTFQLVACR